MIKREILQDLEGDDLTPAPYWIMTRLPPSAPPGPEAALLPNPGPGEVPAAATALPLALPEIVSAASDPSDGDLWSMPPEFHLSWTS